MRKKNKLFSIGDISRFTGASPKSLRYYEELKILNPAYIDPSTGYRYYSFEQTYLIGIIMFCIELDIPLKELAGYIDETETIDYSALLAHGKEIAEKKLKTIQRGLQFIEDIERKITIAEKFHRGQKIYTQELPEKYFWVIPYEKPIDEGMDLFELLKPFFSSEYSEDAYYSLAEYGLMCEHSPAGIQRYVFMELPKHKVKDDVKVIPGGIYFCNHSNVFQIEQAPQIFSEQLKKHTSFLAVETEVFTGKYKVNKPVHELRVIGL